MKICTNEGKDGRIRFSEGQRILCPRFTVSPLHTSHKSPQRVMEDVSASLRGHEKASSGHKTSSDLQRKGANELSGK